MRHVRVTRSALIGLTLGALVALSATPALGGTPSREVISLDDPAAEAFWSAELTAACDAPIVADFEGTVTVHVFTDRNGDFKREIDKYWIRDTFTNTDTGASILLKDVGPDIIFFGKDGALYVAVTGRSLTGSGVIGRTLVNLDTGEVVRESGRVVGSIFDQICPIVAP
jgi:hypothetical protein